MSTEIVKVHFRACNEFFYSKRYMSISSSRHAGYRGCHMYRYTIECLATNFSFAGMYADKDI